VTKTLGASVYLRRVCETIFTWLHQAGVRMHAGEILGFRHVVKSLSHCSAQCTLRRQPQVYAEKYCCSPAADDVRVLVAPFAFSIPAEPMHPAGEDTPERLREYLYCGSRITTHPKCIGALCETHTKHALHQQNMGACSQAAG
jgi:hypothetical protein